MCRLHVVRIVCIDTRWFLPHASPCGVSGFYHVQARARGLLGGSTYVGGGRGPFQWGKGMLAVHMVAARVHAMPGWGWVVEL